MKFNYIYIIVSELTRNIVPFNFLKLPLIVIIDDIMNILVMIPKAKKSTSLASQTG